VIIDTPGMRELQLWGQGCLNSVFGDITELALPVPLSGLRAWRGGRVRGAGSGLEDADEVAWHELKTDLSAALAEKQRWRKIH
jgi:ribosome biogenesis GTPase / thiamine phosphate phosphatase